MLILWQGWECDRRGERPSITVDAPTIGVVRISGPVVARGLVSDRRWHDALLLAVDQLSRGEPVASISALADGSYRLAGTL